MNIDKRVENCLLLDFYGSLLTERQLQVAVKYFEDDVSLAEIAEELGISRQAVRDAVNTAQETLAMHEEKLGLAKRHVELVHQIECVAMEAEKLGAKQEIVEKIKNLHQYL